MELLKPSLPLKCRILMIDACIESSIPSAWKQLLNDTVNFFEKYISFLSSNSSLQRIHQLQQLYRIRSVGHLLLPAFFWVSAPFGFLGFQLTKLYRHLPRTKRFLSWLCLSGSRFSTKHRNSRVLWGFFAWWPKLTMCIQQWVVLYFLF